MKNRTGKKLKEKKSQRAYINRCNARGIKPHIYKSHDGGPVTAVYGAWIANQRGSLVAKMVAPVLSEGDYRETIGALGSDGKEYFFIDGFTIDDRGPKPQRSRQRLVEAGSRLEQGYKYQTSKDSITETIRANEYEFDENGNIA